MNRYGQIDDYTLGNGINTMISYDQNGLTDKIETKLGSAWIQNWDYDFDAITGNMLKRTGLKSGGSLEEEEFTYDDLNRHGSIQEVYCCSRASATATDKSCFQDRPVGSLVKLLTRKWNFHRTNYQKSGFIGTKKAEQHY